MMYNILSMIGYIGGGLVMDWLFVTKIGGFYSDFDYRYWPLSRLRWIGLAALVSAATYLWIMTGRNGPLSDLIPFAILIIGYVASALADVNAQRRAGYRKPPNPRYSDGEYGS